MAGPTNYRAQMTGLAELKAALETLGAEVATKVGHKAQRAAANELRDKLKAAAPVGTGPTAKTRRTKSGQLVEYDYGRLRDNIRVRKLKPRKAQHIVYAVTVGRAFWGAFQEFGTVDMAARPWMRPAFDEAGPDILHTQIDTLRKGIEAIAKKARKGRRP